MLFDTVILDLDGVVYIGPEAVPHAIEALNMLAERGVRLTAGTNNANRPASAVAAHLQRLGLRIDAADIVTSAQAAASFLAERLPSGTPILAIGGEGVADALSHEGLLPLRASADLVESDRVASACSAVLMGYGPLVAWFDLAAAQWAIDRGKRWVATNVDPTVPLQFGRAPGNGALVGLLQRSTGRTPEVVGKPQPALFEALLRRTGAQRALVIGDRLDTDIDGAHATGLRSLLVFTGVHSPVDLAARSISGWPTYVARDLRSLHGTSVEVVLRDGRAWADSDDATVQAVVAAANSALGGVDEVPAVISGDDESPLIDVRALQQGTV